jgi:hypothetical protein
VIFSAPWVSSARQSLRAALPGSLIIGELRSAEPLIAVARDLRFPQVAPSLPRGGDPTIPAPLPRGPRGTRAFPLFLIVLNGFVLAAVGGALVWAVFRIKDRRLWRLAALIGAVGVAVVSAVAIRTASAEVNASERFHFIEYGLITWLFYRAWEPREGAGNVQLVMPVLAGLLVGTADEAFQWYVPIRVGEIGDVFLNLAAIGAGLLFSLGVEPPRRLAFVPPARVRPLVGVTAAAVVLSMAGFLEAAQLGHFVRDPDIGSFRSTFSAEDLVRLSAARSEQWRRHPPPIKIEGFARMAREDHYLTEAVAHVQARNQAWGTDIRSAWLENRILEKYFAPALDTPSYLMPAGGRWPAVQRDDATIRAANAPGEPFVSSVYERYVLVWPRSAVRAGAGAIAAICVVTGFARRRHATVVD